MLNFLAREGKDWLSLPALRGGGVMSGSCLQVASGNAKRATPCGAACFGVGHVA